MSFSCLERVGRSGKQRTLELQVTQCRLTRCYSKLHLGIVGQPSERTQGPLSEAETGRALPRDPTSSPSLFPLSRLSIRLLCCTTGTTTCLVGRKDRGGSTGPTRRRRTRR